MHALRRYLQDGLDARGWQPAELARRSGLTKQRVSQMLTDDREVLPQAPKRETLAAIARAFSVSESVVTAIAFEAMGYDLDVARGEASLSTASDEQIVRALADRLGVGLRTEERDGDGDAAPTSPAGDARARQDYYDLAASQVQDDDTREDAARAMQQGEDGHPQG
ncbi:helix-turn-helix domain-containing protein [Serinicoccus sediminis]|uniref:helix-turn-helix domain-containing protein n=1 Tax=Serinicoccus sediminis TaxID=2306021 RepID=UPI001021762D|nr:helix-turn-helix transcriptional regulator [Serinicoccus sediminis]